jgi:hypothetical protein
MAYILLSLYVGFFIYDTRNQLKIWNIIEESRECIRLCEET